MAGKSVEEVVAEKGSIAPLGGQSDAILAAHSPESIDVTNADAVLQIHENFVKAVLAALPLSAGDKHTGGVRSHLGFTLDRIEQERRSQAMMSAK